MDRKVTKEMKVTTKRKPVFWMAGDSTMQSYAEEKRPQWGWGECLLEKLEGKLAETVKADMEQEQIEGLPEMTYVPQITAFHREDSPFEQEKRYVGRYFELDNCAMAGRSSKTFREEGRLADIEKHILADDYLVIQFGHNDAGSSKPERYVPLEEFQASLSNYVEMALSHGAKPILLSSIVLCQGKESQEGEAGEISRLLPAYGEKMQQYAAKLGISYINMNRLTGECLAGKTKEEAEAMYLPDHVHLVLPGAEAYAELAAAELCNIVKSENESQKMKNGK